MKRSAFSIVVILAVVLAVLAGWRRYYGKPPVRPLVADVDRPRTPVPQPDPAAIRTALFAELQPVRLTNCQLKRFGEPHDGGYLLCANLLKGVQSGYSYGISGYDGWGCEISRTLKVQVHEYDCFNLQEPVCKRGKTTFHGQCVAGEPSTDSAGRLFETPEHQLAKNGDAGRQVVMKIDVEGAEWDTFVKTPDSVLERIDQLAVEFHGSDKPHSLDVVRKLKRLFYIANLHFNNYSCTTRMPPFPAWAYEVLLVNKRLGVPDPTSTRPVSHAANAPNNPDLDDCQASDALAGHTGRAAPSH